MKDRSSETNQKNIGNREYIRDKKINSILGEEIKEEVKEVKKKRFFLW